MQVLAIINSDLSGLVEGEPGEVYQVNGAETRRADLAEGWEWRLHAWQFEPTTLNGPPAGAAPEHLDQARPYRIVSGALAWREAAPPDLTGPQFKSFLRRAGIEEFVAGAVAAALVSGFEPLAYAADVLSSGTTFHFDVTMANAAAAVAALGIEDAPVDFADPEAQADLLVHWRAAAATALPA